PWLQEFPDPVTRICWDNYLCVSPKTANEKKLREGQYVKLTVGDESVEVPVHIQPGQDDRALGLAVGYGRTDVGDVGNNVGVNAYRMAYVSNGVARYSGLKVQLEPTSRRMEFAVVQEHHSMEGRQIVVEATLGQYKENPSANIHRHKLVS